jgi:hypothetical protein
MSDELNNELDQSGAADTGANGNGNGNGGGGADDLVDALAEPDGGAVLVEEKKPLNRSTIVTFVVLVIGAGGLWFMYQRTGPAKAAAADKEAAAAKATINSFLSGGSENIKLMESMLRNTQKVVQQFLNYPSMTQVPLSELRTNPFRIRAEAPAGDKNAAGEAAEKKKREEERLAALRAVENLQLQSIMFGGSRRACMVNGAMYTEGQTVDGFAIEKINQASVVVKNGPYRFELRMQR